MAGRRGATGGMAAAALLALGGCGGDDAAGGGAPPPPPPPTANRAPVFTSAPTVSVAENSSGTIYTATASDPDAQPVSFTLGGTDAARFQLTPGGALSFVTPPDFENPADADANNVYQLTLTATDGALTAQLSLAVTVTDSAQGGFRVVRVGQGFAAPLFLTGVPDGSGRVFVVERAGRVRLLNPANGSINPTPFLDIAASVGTAGEGGLLGFALAPDFATSGAVYVNVTNLSGDTEIRRYTGLSLNPQPGQQTPPGDIVLTFDQPFSNHNGGWIGFDRDGLLVIGSGDGGSGNDPQGNGQNRNTLLGKMLRIDISRDAFPNDPLRDYAIPPGNPFAGGGGAPEILAFGFRNPFRASIDRLTGDLWIGDVGQDNREEIDLIRAGSAGGNFGWVAYEGTLQLAQQAVAGTVFPVIEYSHGSGATQGNSVTGGYVYRGPVESLQGQYVFGDFVAGRIWSVPAANVALGSTLGGSQFTIRTQDFAPATGAIGNIASFGEDEAGNLYIVDFDGEIFAILPAT